MAAGGTRLLWRPETRAMPCSQAPRATIPTNMDLSIGDPANLEEAIAVGSVHKTNPHTYGISYFSSRGPTADGRRKPDVVAPGEKSSRRDTIGKAPVTANNTMWRICSSRMSVTSMATPHVSGFLQPSFLCARVHRLSAASWIDGRLHRPPSRSIHAGSPASEPDQDAGIQLSGSTSAVAMPARSSLPWRPRASILRYREAQSGTRDGRFT